MGSSQRLPHSKVQHPYAQTPVRAYDEYKSNQSKQGERHREVESSVEALPHTALAHKVDYGQGSR